MQEINFFGETTFRNARHKFGIKVDDRRRHFYVLGKTGMGKTSMLVNMAVQDIQAGHGIGFVDPHGEAVESLLEFVPENRVKDVLYFNPADMAYPLAFNVMEEVEPEYRHLVASGLMSVFKKIWPDVWSARMEYILNNSILALLESPGSTLLGVNRMLADVEYRKSVVEQVQDPVVKAFWVQEYARYTQRYEVEATAAIQNKVGQFISNPLVRNIVGQVHSSVDMREVMDGEKILLANLSKGKIGEDNSRLLGALLITKLQLAAMSRVDIPESERRDFFVYIDEFQNFATESFVNILSEARKYHLALILSHQYIAQLGTGEEAKVRDAVFGNVGTIATFRVGAEDAEFLEKEFMPYFMIQDFVNLTKYNIYVKLMIDGISGRPFSAQTLAPPQPLEKSLKEEIIESSRNTYGTQVAKVEKDIAEWTGFLDTAAVTQRPQQQASQQSQTLYDAVCASCGKNTKVVFPPDGKRPVYCKNCRKKMQQKRERGGLPAMPAHAGQAGERRQEYNRGDRQFSDSRPRSSTFFQGKRSEAQSSMMSVKSSPRAEENDYKRQQQPISLKDTASFNPVMFQPSKRSTNGERPRKEVNQEEVRQALSEAVLRRAANTQQTPASSGKREGVLHPGETISL